MSTFDYDLLAAAILRQTGGTVPVKAGPPSPVSVSSGGATAEQVHVGIAEVVSGSSEAEFHTADGASESGSASSGGVCGEIGDEVRQRVQFGDAAGGMLKVSTVGGRSDMAPGAGYFKQVVRGPAAMALLGKVVALCGDILPKTGRSELAICAYTAGTMPAVVANGKIRLRSLAAVGDATITVHLASQAYVVGMQVESGQGLRSRLTNNAKLATLLVESGLSQYVNFAPGVDVATATTGATAYEAIVGVLALYKSPEVVRRFLVATGFYAGIRELAPYVEA